jgi:hypothetical protein
MKSSGSDAGSTKKAHRVRNEVAPDRMGLRVAFSSVILCASVVSFSLDREAFTFTNYDLNVQRRT